MASERDVERIKCRRCRGSSNADDCDVQRTFMCATDEGGEGCEIDERLVCPRCGSLRVLEVLGETKRRAGEGINE
jgi:DNA-directed RNA polymerase subunit RPC12/RpoP